MASPERWIVIPNWDKFQHYKDRDPVWIKNYRDLLRRDDYRELSFHQRGVLHGLWMEYAASNRQIRDSTLSITRRLGQRVTRATLDSLSNAGYIDFSASRPLAPVYLIASLEKEVEVEKKRGAVGVGINGSEPEGSKPRLKSVQEQIKESLA